MKQTLLKTKLQNVTVTHSEMDYDGSCAIDEEWLTLSGIHPHEQIYIYNVTNGKHFITYAISAKKGSKIISVNGAAAHKAEPGDCLDICAYTELPVNNALDYQPRLFHFDKNCFICIEPDFMSQAT